MAFVQVEDGRLVAERASARTPPTPRTTSCRIRSSRSIVYSRGTSASDSSRYSGTLPDVEPPDVHRDGLAGEIDFDGDVLLDQPDAGEVGLRVFLPLPPLLVDHLGEVALPVEQADRDERQLEIGGGLQVVAREHAEPARVDREAVVDRELHREVRHYHAAHLTRQPKRSKRAAVGYNR